MMTKMSGLLVVTTVKRDDSLYSFICRQKSSANTYIEIFTGQKIKETEIITIEPLKNYFSVLSICNYTTGKPLLLTKRELLTKYIDINHYLQGEKKLDSKIQQTKENFRTDTLVVAHLQKMINGCTNLESITEPTQQKYIFETIMYEDTIKYRDVFTGIIFDTKPNIKVYE